MALRELLAAFDIKVDSKQLEHANHALDEAKEKAGGLGEAFEHLAGFVEAALGAFAVERIVEFAEKVVTQAAAVGHLSDALGISSDDLQTWEAIMVRAGGSADSAGTLFRVLASNINKASEGSKESVKAFGDLGVSFKNADGSLRPVGDVLGDVGAALADMTDGTKRAALGSALLGRGVLQVLPAFSGGAAKFREMAGEVSKVGKVYDQDFIEQSKEAQIATQELGYVLQRLGVAFTKWVLPVIHHFEEAMKPVVEGITDVINNTDRMRAIFVAVAVLAAPAVVGALIDIGIALAPIAASAIAAFLPFLALAAVGLLIEDLVVLLEGGDSELGHLLDTFGGVGTAKAFVDDLNAAWEIFKDVIGGARDAFNDFTAWFGAGISADLAWVEYLVSNWLHAWDEVLPGPVKALVDFMTGIFASFFDWVATKMANLIPAPIRDLAKGLFDTQNDKMDAAARAEARGRASPVLSGAIDTYGNAVPPPAAPLPFGQGAARTTTLTDQRTTTIQVGPNASPGETGRAVAGEVRAAQADDRAAILAGVE